MSISSISLSGMQAAQQALGVAAGDIANMSTPGFQRQLADQMTHSDGGVSTQVSLSSAAADDGLNTDMVGQIRAKDEFLANLSVFKTQDQMTSSLLNIRS